jgi:ABC-type transport system involved in multi-copper enzyme maturation permease subunit
LKIRAIALSTFGTLVRNKLIVLFCAIFLVLLLFVTTPLSNMRHNAVGEEIVLQFVSFLMFIVSGFGSLLAAWSAAEAVAGEMKSGTILAVMARPVRRWEFLLGKYLGVQLLMLVYVAFMFGMSYVLAAIGGQSIHAAPWVLIVYPILRYAIYSALAMLLVTVMHPVLAFVGVLITSVLALLVMPGAPSGFMTDQIWMPLYAVLPSMSLLSESQFLGMTQASLQPIPWTNHLTALVYGLDYALVIFLLAVWSFRRRALTRD